MIAAGADTERPWLSRFDTPLYRGLLALALPLIAGVVALGVHSVVDYSRTHHDFIWVIFYPTIFVAAWLGSAIAASASLAVSVLFIVWFVLPPTHTLVVGAPYRWTMLAYILVGIVMIVIQQRRSRARKRLAAANALLSIYVDHGMAGMYTNRADHFLSANAEFVEMFGYDSEDEIIGLTSYDLLAPEEQAHMREVARKRWSGESPSYQEVLRAKRRDGSEFWMEIRGRVVDLDGEKTAVGVVIDVTQRMDALAELAEKEALFDRASRIGKVGVFQVQVPSFELTCSAQIWEMLGIPAPEDMPTVEFVESMLAGPDRDLPHQLLQQAVTDGEAWDRVVESRRRNGEPMWVRVVGEPIYEEGVVVRIEGTVSDVTEQHLQAQTVAETQERFRAVFEQSPDGIFLNDAHGNYVDVNPAGCEMLGYTCEEMLQLNVADVLVPEARELPALGREDFNEGVTLFEGELLRKDGTRFVGETLVRALHNGEVLAVVRDISESHAAAEALRESEERYRSLVEQSPDGIFVGDASGSLIDVNQAGVELLRLSRERIIGMPVSDILVPDELPRLAGVFDELSHSASHLGSWRVVRGDGTVIIAELMVRRLSDGRLQAVVRDVTERERREREVREAKERLELAAEAAGIGVWEAIDGVVTFDARMMSLYGMDRPAGVLAQEQIGAAVHPDDLTWLRASDNRVRNDGAAVSSEFRVIYPDGSVHWLLDHRKRVQDPAAARSHIVGVCTDITERKRAEAELRDMNISLERRVAMRTSELEETNNELEAFTYAVSHDLRAPLRRMSGLCEALEQDYASQLDDAAKQFMHLLTEEAAQTSSLIEGLLDLSRSSRGEIQRIIVDVSALADSLLTRLQTTDPDRIVECRVERDLIVYGDRRMVESLLTNLLDNAWKYSCCDISARIEVYADDADGHRWICVRDNGAGFDPRYEENLFVPFQRLHSEDEFKGVGIGLATVNRIVRRHGGDIRATGEVGKGATFRFWLPEPSEL
ncbi:MAG TPA: PAS domain S-box protein [Coriobacteriia bacterium]|nr:PAS domain S-box protein [Coriobacteriia bacterium]